MRFLFNKVTLSVGVLLILVTLGLGEFIFWRVLKVSCSNDQVIEGNTPRYFVADGEDQGPFRGERWIDGLMRIYPDGFLRVVRSKI